jgi:hypothetical protein
MIGHPELVVVAGRFVVRALIEFPFVLRVERQRHDILENRVAALFRASGDDLFDVGALPIGKRFVVALIPASLAARLLEC